MSLSIGATIAAVYFRQSEERQRRLVGEKSRLAEQMSTLAEEKSTLADRMSTLAGEKQQALTKSLESETRLSTALGREQAALREADQQRTVTRQNLYDAQMANAARLWESHRSRTLFDELLQGWQPKAGETDLRGWEWYYFRSLPHRQMRSLFSAAGDVISLRWSPDGELLAAKYSSLETPIRIWDVGSGATLFDLNLAGFDFKDTLAFSPDGKRLAVAGANGTIYCFDARSGHERQVLRGHDAPATAVAYSRDGTVLASGDQSGAVKLWRVATGREFASWKAHDREITCLSCDRTGASLVTASGRNVIVWDTAAKTQRGSAAYPSRVTSASFDPDGRRLATSLAAFDGERVQILDVATGKREPVLPGHMHWVESAQWSADGTRLVTCSRDQSVIVWDAVNVAPLAVLRGFPDELYSAAMSPDLTQVAAGGGDGMIFITDARNPREYQTVGTEDVAVDNYLSPLVWSHDGEYLAASGGRDGTTVVHYSQGLQVATRLAGAHASPLASLDFGPGGERLASADRNGNVVIWDVAAGMPLVRFRAHDHSLNAIDVSRDGKWLATAANGPVAKLWNFATGEVVHVLDGHGESGGMFSGAIDVAFDPDSKRLAVATSVGLVKIWDVSAGTLIRTLRHSDDYVTCLAWSADGRRLASGGMDRLIRIWDPDIDDALLVARGHTDWVHRLSWHIDGSRIASVGAGGGTDVKIWDTATGREILQLPQRDKRVRSVAWAPDGMRLASASSDGSVRVYSALAGCEIERSPRLLPIVEKHLAAAPDSVDDLRLRMEIHQRSGDLDEAAQDRERLVAAYETLLEAEPRRVDRAGELAELLLDAPVDWVTLVPSGLRSEGGATFAIQPDGSILVGGPNANLDTYTIVAPSPRQGITGLRLETLPHPSFVAGGSGRSRENGNFNLSELSMRVASAGADSDGVSWAHAFSDFELSLPHHQPNTIGNVIDGNERTFWEVWPKQNLPHAAVFFPAVAVARKPGDELTMTLKFAQYDYHNLGRFRLSVTDRLQGAAQFEELRGKMGRGETNGFAALGTVYALRSELDKAVEAFARGLDVAGSTDVAADILKQSSQFGDAIDLLIERRPTHAQLLAYSARRHDERGETELAAAARARARATCEESLRLNVDDEDLAALLAELIDCQRKTAAKDRRQDSDGHALATEELNPLAAAQSAQGFAALGIAYKLEGSFDKAADCFVKAWDLSADFDRRAQLVAVAETNDDALETLVRLHGDEPLLLAASARRYLARGEKELAADARLQARGILEKQLGDYADDRVAAAMLANLLLEDSSTDWIVLRPAELKSDAGATLTLSSDGSVVAGGVNPDHDGYTHACEWDGSPFVALRIEALPHASLMNQGPGRCEKCGNFNLTKLAVRAFSESSPTGVEVPLVQAIDDMGEPATGGAAGAIDDRPETAWSINPHMGRPHWAVFQVEPARVEGAMRLEIRLESQSPAPRQHTLGRFRISICRSREILSTERWRSIASQTKSSVCVKLGAAYFVRGQWDRAVAYLEKAQRPATFSDRVLSLLPGRLRGDCESPSANVTELFMLALAHERNGQPDAARRVYDEALTLLRQNSSDPMTVVFARQAMEKIGGLSSDEVEALIVGALRDTELAALTATIVRDPSNAQARVERGHWYARRCRWQEAADDLTQVIQLRPNDQRRWFEMGILLAQLADARAYEQHCREMVSRWAEASERGVADTTAKVCLLARGVAGDDARVAHLVNTALTAPESDSLYPFFVLLKGLHAFRNGRHADAIAACVESRRRFSEKPDVYLAADHAIEALAHHGANEPDEARRSLTEAERILDEHLPKLGHDVLGDEWADWLIADLLRREAAELIRGTQGEGR
jgi:WD40 repeat protein/tetratricopeptide (TPR) repeat protein